MDEDDKDVRQTNNNITLCQRFACYASVTSVNLITLPGRGSAFLIKISFSIITGDLYLRGLGRIRWPAVKP